MFAVLKIFSIYVLYSLYSFYFHFLFNSFFCNVCVTYINGVERLVDQQRKANHQQKHININVITFLVYRKKDLK